MSDWIRSSFNVGLYEKLNTLAPHKSFFGVANHFRINDSGKTIDSIDPKYSYYVLIDGNDKWIKLINPRIIESTLNDCRHIVCDNQNLTSGVVLGYRRCLTENETDVMINSSSEGEEKQTNEKKEFTMTYGNYSYSSEHGSWVLRLDPRAVLPGGFGVGASVRLLGESPRYSDGIVSSINGSTVKINTDRKRTSRGFTVSGINVVQPAPSVRPAEPAPQPQQERQQRRDPVVCAAPVVSNERNFEPKTKKEGNKKVFNFNKNKLMDSMFKQVDVRLDLSTGRLALPYNESLVTLVPGGDGAEPSLASHPFEQLTLTVPGFAMRQPLDQINVGDVYVTGKGSLFFVTGREGTSLKTVSPNGEAHTVIPTSDMLFGGGYMIVKSLFNFASGSPDGALAGGLNGLLPLLLLSGDGDLGGDNIGMMLALSAMGGGAGLFGGGAAGSAAPGLGGLNPLMMMLMLRK